jgi:hypothetical protein
MPAFDDELTTPAFDDELTTPAFDDELTTPALDANAGMASDIYTIPLTDYDDDFDNMPSLFGEVFGSTAYDSHDGKETVGRQLSPSNIPLHDMDDMYEILPGTPVIDDVSVQPSPLHVDDSSAFPPSRESASTGTRKNITPEALVPYDAPIQPRQYRIPSATSRKELPSTFSRKRARTSEPAEAEAAVGPTLSEEDAIRAKRLQNTLAARRSRKQKLDHRRELENAIDTEREDKEARRREHVLELLRESEQRDGGHEVP